MLRKFKSILLAHNRQLATKIKKSVILQDTEKIPIFQYPRSTQSDRRVYVWGLSETGALGIQRSLKQQSKKQTAIIHHPSRLHFAQTLDVVDIACGYGFSVFAVRREDGISLFGTGINTDAQVGYHKYGGATNKPLELIIYPAPISLPKSIDDQKIQITKCAAGRAHLLALSDDGIVYALGNNAYGQCGRPIVVDEAYASNQIIYTIEKLGGEKIVNVHCGQDHSLFLTDSGKLYSCGWSADGQTGLGLYKSTDCPTLVGGEIATEKIVKIAGTVDCVLALNDKGEVFGWGNGEYGQLDRDDENQQISVPQIIKSTSKLGKIIDIAAGGSYCLVLNENGDVFIWGYGILGLGPSVEHRKHPTQIPPTLFGRNEFSPSSYVTSIYSGISHMGAINDENNLYMWGNNRFGCLGLGHKNDQFFPYKASVGAKVLKISCGVDHTIALCKPFM